MKRPLAVGVEFYIILVFTNSQLESVQSCMSDKCSLDICDLP